MSSLPDDVSLSQFDGRIRVTIGYPNAGWVQQVGPGFPADFILRLLVESYSKRFGRKNRPHLTPDGISSGQGLTYPTVICG